MGSKIILGLIIAIVWVIYTFGAYSAKFGFMAIGEVIVGAVIAGFFTHNTRLIIAVLGVPITILAWIVL